ncbi:dolichyl pyrophosphate Man9GlcNAc2 alpha-1,3-glucosyltransferase-like [Anneissia japonica]|uniref:dolichyl pyrophosphate Man9GlcNAc2 alpha-1,3-glucosyltransferase-like n=1 Tax=Anneissia japonica TaxID=1529436 RepID=UPI001425B1D8|nr:dolichyl pyrophosphate Man9GlcNAc2 alpha-1,3-glucosyltransferase-like [Anneissia japonica]
MTKFSRIVSFQWMQIGVIVLVGVTVRWSVSLNAYSGAGKPPMFGDYEAQRHWMEITTNLAIDQWYENGTDNDLLYWGLDYPPLTAYHSWICGKVSSFLNPDWVELYASRGYESYEHKLFMRYSVLVVDLLLYIPAVLLLCWVDSSKRMLSFDWLMVAMVILLYPGLIVIDHGHFQYNNASLGFCLLAIIAVTTGHDLWGSISFVLALNYKQMELYHAMPFFCYLLGKCFRSSDENGLWKLIKIGVIVIASFIICWLPFLTTVETILQVVHRLFPFARGLYEDKVANFWCSIEPILRTKEKFSQDIILKIALVSTVGALLPSSLHLLYKPTVRSFRLALVNSSLAFFLFSFQVHEKSILLVALPVCMMLQDRPFASTWFLLISTLSMFPLLVKDGQALSTSALCLLFLLASRTLLDSQKLKQHIAVRIIFWLSILGMSVLCAFHLVIPPPPKYPDLYPLFISAYSCAHFLVFFAYCQYLQFTTTDDEKVRGPTDETFRNTKTKRKVHKKD